MITLFILTSIIAIILILGLRSTKIINFITNLHSLVIAALAGYGLFSVSFPVYWWDHNLFLDTFSAYEIFITGIIFWLAALYAKGYTESLIEAGELNSKNVRLFYVVFNALLLSLVLAFSANNLALLWIFAELSTVLSAVLIVLLNAKENIVAAMKYVFITSIAMIFSFLGLILLFTITKYDQGQATLRWDLLLDSAPNLPPQLLIVSFVLLFIGFAAKAGLVPFHTWLPVAYSKAPSNVSVVLSGSVSSLGIYALIRLLALMKQNTLVYAFSSTLLLVFGILTITIAAFSMVSRTNLKKLIAFSSMEGMGLMTLGISLGTPISIFWVLFLLGAQALVKALLFFSAGIIHRQYNSVKVESIHSLFLLQPLPAVGLIVGSLALIGVPLLPLFIPKLFIMSQLALRSITLLFIVLVLFVIVAAAFVLFLLKIIPPREKLPPKFNIPLSMKLTVMILLILILLLGLFIPEFISTTLQSIVVQLGW